MYDCVMLREQVIMNQQRWFGELEWYGSEVFLEAWWTCSMDILTPTWTHENCGTKVVYEIVVGGRFTTCV